MTSKITKRLAAGVAALALGFTGAVALVAPASAADGPNIPDETGTLTVHKFAGDTTDLPHNGTEITTPIPGVTPLDGVTFEVQLVSGPDINLATNDGWDRVAELTPADVKAAPYTLGAAEDGTTGEGGNPTGQAVFSDLPVGLYLVTETSAGTNPVTSPAQEFLVTVPLPADGAWNFDIHAYPKNTLGEDPTKTVDETNAYGLGDTVEWTVTANVPQFGVDEYVITDTLDERLTYVGTPAPTVTVGATTFTVGDDSADVEVSVDESTNTVTFEFTDAGLAKLVPGELTLTFNTTVNGVGTIVNTAFVNGVETTEAQTVWVEVIATKVDEEGAPLTGAVFSVFTAETGGTALVIGGETEFASGPDGVVTIPGLKAGEAYWLEEIRAPEGYYALEDRIRIPASGVLTGLPVEDVALQYNAGEIENTQVPEWELPLTGGDGALWFGIGGGALVAIAAGAALVIARRQKATV